MGVSIHVGGATQELGDRKKAQKCVSSKKQIIVLHVLFVASVLIAFFGCVAVVVCTFSHFPQIIRNTSGFFIIGMICLCYWCINRSWRWFNTYKLDDDQIYMHVDESGTVVRVGEGGWRMKNMRYIALKGECFGELFEFFRCDRGNVLRFETVVECLSQKMDKRLQVSFSTQFVFSDVKEIHAQILLDNVIQQNIASNQDSFSMERFFATLLKESFEEDKKRCLVTLVEAGDFRTIESIIDAAASKCFPLGVKHTTTVSQYTVIR